MGVKGLNQIRLDHNIYQKHRYTYLLLLFVLAVPEHLSNINLSVFAFFYCYWILQNQTTNICTVYMRKKITNIINVYTLDDSKCQDDPPQCSASHSVHFNYGVRAPDDQEDG